MKKKYILFWCIFINLNSISLSSAHVTCNLMLTNIDFGQVNIKYDYIAKTIGSIFVKCINNSAIPNNVNYNISFNLENGGRGFKSKNNKIFYELYSDSNYMTILGNGYNGTTTLNNSYQLLPYGSRTDNFPIYGKMPYNSSATVNNYLDKILITLTY